MSKTNKKKLYTLYTIIFVTFSALIIYYYYSQNKSLIYAGDDYRSSFFENVYLSRYIRQIINNFIETKKIVIPQWDFCISEGYDILHSFNTGVFGDPFCFFGFIFPDDLLYLFYDLMRFARVYCAGLSFIYLCLYFNKNNFFAILAGTISYCFCSSSITALLINPFMITPMVFFPLVIVGINKIINNEKPYLLVVSIMFSAISNFYFFYGIVILTILYSIIKLIFVSNRNIKQIFINLFKIAGWSVLGTCIGAVIVLPVAMSFLSYNRLDVSYPFHLFYPFDTYLKLFKSFFINTDTSSGLISSYSILCFISLVYLIKNKKNKLLPLLLFIGIIFTVFPFFEQMFNGFSYPSTRWHRFLSLLICYIIVESFDGIQDLRNDFRNNILVVLLYYSLCILTDVDNIKLYLVLVVLFTISLLIVNKTKIDSVWKNRLLLSVSLLGTLLCIYFSLSPNYWNFAKNGVDIKNVILSNNTENNTISAIDDNSMWRYSGNNLNDNESTLGKHSSTNFYWSISNNNVINYRNELGMSDHSCFHYTDYNNKSSLMNLASIKYFLADVNDINIPFGYELYKKDNNYNVYVNNKVLPFIYAYSNSMSIDDWNKLNIVQKQEALLKSVVLNDIHSNNNNSYSSRIIDYNVSSKDDVIISNNVIKTTKENASINLDFEYQGAGEYYFIIKDLYWNSNENNSWQNHLYSNIKVNTYKSSNTIYYKNPNHTRYSNKHTFSINLGYFGKCINSVELIFPETGDYLFGSIEMIYLPLNQQENDIEELKDIVINKLETDVNTFKAEVTISENKYVVLSIPFSKCWTAYVDGNPAVLYNTNIQYMGLKLEKGNHSIVLKYNTPFLKEGFIISIIGIVIFVLYLLIDKKIINIKRTK